MKRRSLALCGYALVALATSLAAAEPALEPPVCATAEACLEALRNVSGNKRGIGPADEALVRRLLSFGAPIIPPLVDMLADPNESAATLAAYALRESEHIDARFLPEIKAGLDRKLGWLAPALCRIDGDEAAREAVARYIVSDSAPNNQEAYALQLCGRRALPHMIDAARCTDHCDSDVHWNLAHALREMEGRGEAGPELMRIVREPALPERAAIGVLSMIGALEADGLALEPDLLELRRSRPGLAPFIDNALIGIGSRAGIQVFIERISDAPNDIALRDLAELGATAADAGPAVVALLEHEAWDVRIAAARTLGYIGYAEASAALMRLLDDPRDVRLNWVAAESLGRLHAADAVAALRITADTHWYPPVRRSASTAIENIEQLNLVKSNWHERNFAFEYFEYQHMGKTQAACEHPLATIRRESRKLKLVAGEADEDLQRLVYTMEDVSYELPAAGDALGKGDEDVADVRSGRLVGRTVLVERTPNVALRVDGGWLTGSNRGEWGGELVFIDDGGASAILITENVEDIYAIGKDVIALTGLDHMGSNLGMVHALSRDSSGTWSSRPWRALPGAPISSWLVETGEVLVNASSGGTLLLAPDGTFRIAPCDDEEPPTQSE